jgi:peptidoglycan biosynthesis protein MviN/MurJ (putative lipid II flippase)
MTTITETKRPSRASRRAGYVVAAAINAALLWFIHVWPGWDAVPFLTADFETVLWLIDLSLVVTIALNLLYLVRDPRWLTAAGAVVTTAIGLVAAVRLLQVFPFDFGDSEFWPVVVRVLLWVAVIGAGIGIIANLVALVRARGTV